MHYILHYILHDILHDMLHDILDYILDYILHYILDYIEQEWFHNVRLGIEHSLKHAPKKERQVLPATQAIDPGPRH